MCSQHQCRVVVCAASMWSMCICGMPCQYVYYFVVCVVSTDVYLWYAVSMWSHGMSSQYAKSWYAQSVCKVVVCAVSMWSHWICSQYVE